MEKLRQKLDRIDYHTLQPLGRSKPGRGIVSEDLGRTEFKTSSTTNAKPSEIYESNDNFISDDDLDVLGHDSSPTLLTTAHKKSKVLKQSLCSTESQVAPRSRSRVRPRPNLRDTDLPDNNEENKTKPSHHYSHLSSNSLPPSNQLALQRLQKYPPRERGQTTSPLEELNSNKAKTPKASKGKREKEPFPMQDDCHAMNSELNCRPPSRFHRDPAPFPMAMASPGRSQRRHSQSALSTRSSSTLQDPCSKKDTTRVPQPFPLDSSATCPLQGTLSDEDDNNGDELALTDNDNQAILAYGGPRPFPMVMTQCLSESPHHASNSKRSAKSNHEQRANKRSRSSSDPNTIDVLRSLSIEGESYVDPESLCPYCDEPWPSSPSPTLLYLLERTKRKSYTDPRPGNALGLKAPLAAFIELCQRHRFEMTHLPLALDRGWPTRLDFSGLPNRIRSFRNKLGRFIDHPNESQFWRDVRDDVREMGRMKVVSVSGQYATFERTQPGYYGEQGSIIIHQTLYSIFPPDDIPLTSVDPLTRDQFLTRVLVPETAVLLIQEDMRLPTKEEALRVLDESKKYGIAMFPEQAQGEEAAEVGEQLARERAKERRKLLEARGEADADVQRQVDRERRVARKGKGRDNERRASRRKGKESESDSDPRGDGKKESRKGMGNVDLLSDSSDSTVQTRGMQLKEGEGIPVLKGLDERTLRLMKEQSRASSIISWRSKRSTSLDMRLAKPTSRSSSYTSSRKPISSSPRNARQENHQNPQWIFDLRNVSSSPDHDDMDFIGIPTRNKDKPNAGKSVDSDSDVVVMQDNSTPKASRPKLNSNSRKIVQRSIINDSSDSEVAAQKATPKPSGAHKQKAEKRRDQAAVGMTLGRTQRKKKGMTRDKPIAMPAGNSRWLLDEISD